LFTENVCKKVKQFISKSFAYSTFGSKVRYSSEERRIMGEMQSENHIKSDVEKIEKMMKSKSKGILKS